MFLSYAIGTEPSAARWHPVGRSLARERDETGGRTDHADGGGGGGGGVKEAARGNRSALSLSPSVSFAFVIQFPARIQ